jgi:DNA replication licensing factor MCM4
MLPLLLLLFLLLLQMIRLQETPDEIPEGETPHSVTLFAFDSLVDAVRPGDRVEVTGIFRAVPRRQNPKMRVVRSVYKTYIDVIHFRGGGAGGGVEEAEGSAAAAAAGRFSPEQVSA